jgi:hypothetical protein
MVVEGGSSNLARGDPIPLWLFIEGKRRPSWCEVIQSSRDGDRVVACEPDWYWMSSC